MTSKLKLEKRPPPAVPAKRREESVGSTAMEETRWKPKALGLLSQKLNGVARALVTKTILVEIGPLLLVPMIITSVMLLVMTTYLSTVASFDQLPAAST